MWRAGLARVSTPAVGLSAVAPRLGLRLSAATAAVPLSVRPPQWRVPLWTASASSGCPVRFLSADPKAKPTATLSAADSKRPERLEFNEPVASLQPKRSVRRAHTGALVTLSAGLLVLTNWLLFRVACAVCAVCVVCSGGRLCCWPACS
jgi:hypothetical protein